MYLCLCKGVTERDVERFVSAGHCTAEALVAALGLEEGGTCGRCPAEIGQCGLAAWCKGTKRLSFSDDRPDATVRLAASVAGAGGAGGAAATGATSPCGLAACSGSICAACASRELVRPGTGAIFNRQG